MVSLRTFQSGACCIRCPKLMSLFCWNPGAENPDERVSTSESVRTERSKGAGQSHTLICIGLVHMCRAQTRVSGNVASWYGSRREGCPPKHILAMQRNVARFVTFSIITAKEVCILRLCLHRVNISFPWLRNHQLKR